MQNASFRRCAVLMAVAAASLTVAPALRAAPAPAGAKAYVANSDTDDVSVVDLTTMTEITKIPVGDEPHNPAATPDGAFVFVPNRLGTIFDGMTATPSVSVIDTASNTVVQTIGLTPREPYNCVVSPDGATLYVVCKVGNSVSVVDIATRQQVTTIALSASTAAPEGIAITPDGTKLYVVNTGSGTVDVISTSTRALVGSPIPVNSSPRDAGVTADGSKVMVVGDGAPVVILTATGAVSPVSFADLGTQSDVAIHGNLAYAANVAFNPPVEAKGPVKSFPSPGDGSLDVYDLGTQQYVTSIQVSASRPSGVDLLSDGSFAYVTAENASSLQELDLTTQEDTDNFATVGSGPRGVVVVEAVEIVDSFFLPKKVAYKKNAGAPSKSVFNASGFFDTGSKVVDLTASATLSVGGFDIAIPSLNASSNGRTFTYQAGGVKFVVVKNPFGSSRAKFRLTYTGDLGATVPTNGTVELRFSNDAVDGNCEVLLQNGGFRLGKKRGALSKPNVFVVRSHAFVNGGGKDSLAIIVGLATGGVTPAAAPEVRVQYGSVLSATIPAASFARKGDSYVFKGDAGGITGVTLDYLREQVTIVGKDLDLGTFPAGQSPLTIIVGVGTEDRGVAVRVARQGNLLKY